MEIKIDRLRKSFNKTKVLDEISAEIGAGELVALVGNNGAGKTTLMECLATLLAPDKGEILFDGSQLSFAQTKLRARFHYLQDIPCFLSDKPIDHILLAASLYDRDLSGLKESLVGWLREFDLLDIAEKKLDSLSRGQRYKVAFVAMLAINPELWILDEPFAAGVDPVGVAAIKRNLNKALGSGAIVLYSTQIIELAQQFSDRVWLLSRGKLRLDVETKSLPDDMAGNWLEAAFQELRIESVNS